MVKRAKEDDYLGPSRGLAGVFHKFMMLLLFPLRKPLWFLLIVFVLFLAPTFRGVKPAEVHTWYWGHIKSLTSEAKTQISNKAQEVMPNVNEKVEQAVQKIAAKADAVTNTSSEQEPKIVANQEPQREVRRKMFEKAQAPAAVVATPPMVVEATQPQKYVVKTVVVQTQAPAKLNLKYLDVPQEVSGVPQVVNANELKVAGKPIFLYGIFVSPNTDKGIEAEVYLRRLVAEKSITCKINAYTYQNVATAICHVGEVNINRQLVEMGYSKNVALD